MKFVLTTIITLFFAFPLLSQNNLGLDSSKTDSTKKQDSTKFFNDKLFDNFFSAEPSKKIKIIPIPPAITKNRKVELLPLYKQGKRKTEFLRK